MWGRALWAEGRAQLRQGWGAGVGRVGLRHGSHVRCAVRPLAQLRVAGVCARRLARGMGFLVKGAATATLDFGFWATGVMAGP